MRHTHELVPDDEIIDQIVVSEGYVRHSDAAVESVGRGRISTDEPIDFRENNRIVEYEGTYYEMTSRSYLPTRVREPQRWTVARAVLVLLGFELLLTGPKKQALETIESE